MNTNLVRALMSMGIIRQGTVIQAYQNVRSLSCQCDSKVIGSFIINRARLLGGTRVVFDTINLDQTPHSVQSEEIIMVDGMMVNRIASSHNLSLEGVAITGRSRRGRRKKVPVEAPPCDLELR